MRWDKSGSWVDEPVADDDDEQYAVESGIEEG